MLAATQGHIVLCQQGSPRGGGRERGAIKALLHTYPYVEGKREQNHLKKFPQAPGQSHAPLDAAHQCHPTCECYYTAHLPFPGRALPSQGRAFLGSLARQGVPSAAIAALVSWRGKRCSLSAAEKEVSFHYHPLGKRI